MDQESATGILRWIAETFRNNGVGVILYEPIGGHDAFGRMMIRNLSVGYRLKNYTNYIKTRGINLKTLSAYPTLQSQTLRLKSCGFESSQDSIDINLAHDQWMGRDELQRISRLELLDEMEEWRLLAAHYCVVWGCNSAAGSSSSAFEGWKDIKNTPA
jgi:[phosphatase 2A protein]-leucine-carboxy methyltransferase